MSGPSQKESVITFKADASLLEALRSIPNRSEFIRAAILSALDHHCPLCGGTGVLTPNQRQHWEEFAARHPLHECDDCHEVHLVCSESPRGGARSQASGKVGPAAPAAGRTARKARKP